MRAPPLMRFPQWGYLRTYLILEAVNEDIVTCRWGPSRVWFANEWGAQEDKEQ